MLSNYKYTIFVLSKQLSRDINDTIMNKQKKEYGLIPAVIFIVMSIALIIYKIIN